MVERVNESEPLLMPRHRWPWRWDVLPGCRTGCWKAAGGGCSALISRVDATVPGLRDRLVDGLVDVVVSSVVVVLVCANANGAASPQTKAMIVFFTVISTS